MSVLRRWDDLDSSNEEEVTIDETSYEDLVENVIFCYKLDLAFNNVKPKDRYFVLD